MINNLTIDGNLTRDPELKFHGNSALLTFSMANNESFKNKDKEWESRTVFIDVTCWGEKAQKLADHLRKGSGVIVTGKLKQDTWSDKTTGKPRSKIVINAKTIDIVVSLKDTSKPAYTPQNKDDDNIPF